MVIHEFVIYSKMNYIKKYEFFNFNRKKDNIDIDVMKDIVESELDGLNFRGHDVSEGIRFDNVYYRVGISGKPKIKKDKWYGEDIEYAYTPSGNYQAFIDRGLNRLGKINSGNFKSGICLFLNEETFGLMDMRERFFLIHKVYEKLNSDRFNEYNIKFSLYRLTNIPNEPFVAKYLDYGILFY